MDKLPVLIVGGEERNIKKCRKYLDITHLSQKRKTLPSSGAFAPDVKAVVVITRFVSRQLNDKAKVFAKNRKVPCFSAKTGNYVLSELEKAGLIKLSEEPKKAKTKAKVKESERSKAESKPKPKALEKSTGISHDDLWDLYGDKAVEFVRSVLSEGDKVREGYLLKEVSSEIGVPVNDIKGFIDEFVIRGVVYRTVGDTLKVPGEDYEYEPDPVPAVMGEEKKRKGTRYDELALMIAGMPEGPYDSKTDIQFAMMDYGEFRRRDGSLGGRSMYWWPLRRAIEVGVVEERDGKFFIKHDPEVSLTFDPTKDKPARNKRGAKKAKKSKKPMRRAESKAKVSEGVAVEISKDLLEKVKNVVSPEYWDECACVSIKRMYGFGEEYVKSNRSAFEKDWDNLAWSAISRFPMSIVVRALK